MIFFNCNFLEKHKRHSQKKKKPTKTKNRGDIRLCMLSIKIQRVRQTAMSLNYGHEGRECSVLLLITVLWFLTVITTGYCFIALVETHFVLIMLQGNFTTHIKRLKMSLPLRQKLHFQEFFLRTCRGIFCAYMPNACFCSVNSRDGHPVPAPYHISVLGGGEASSHTEGERWSGGDLWSGEPAKFGLWHILSVSSK